jgi:hypothetical protein
MKKLLLTIICLSGIGLAHAQTVSVTPAPSATPPASAQAAMKLPPQTQAAFVAGQIIQQVTTILNQVIQVIDNGVPEQNGGQAISAKDLQAALGANNVMRLRSAVELLSETQSQPSPTPTPTPKK